MQIVISPFSGVGGFGEDLDPTLFEYTLKRQNAADQVPDWLTVSGNILSLKRPLTSDMVTNTLNIVIRADYYGIKGGT